MDMDDDFMGSPEFALSSEQGAIVNEAISLASSLDGEGFGQLNPLIAIMQWWQTRVAADERAGISPEQQLTEACRRFVDAHSK